MQGHVITIGFNSERRALRSTSAERRREPTYRKRPSQSLHEANQSVVIATEKGPVLYGLRHGQASGRSAWRRPSMCLSQPAIWFQLPGIRDASLRWSIPVTWVTVHSEDIGNTFGPNG